jgi:hypothetical protein
MVPFQQQGIIQRELIRLYVVQRHAKISRRLLHLVTKLQAAAPYTDNSMKNHIARKGRRLTTPYYAVYHTKNRLPRKAVLFLSTVASFFSLFWLLSRQIS